MKSYRDTKMYTAYRGVPARTMLGQGEGVSKILFEMHKLAKRAENHQKEIKRLTTHLKNKVTSLKALKSTFDSLKSRVKTMKLPFPSNGKKKMISKTTNSTLQESRLLKAQNQIDSMNKFFEFDLEY